MIARLAAAALAAALIAAVPAAAQDTPETISPLRVEADHNGVNIVTGKMTLQGPSLSVPAAPNLTFDRIHNARPQAKGEVVSSGESASGSVSVHTGTGTSESFTCSDSDCQSATGTGSSFVLFGRQIPPTSIGRYVQAGTGAIWSFARPAQDVITGTGARKFTYYASAISYPNGETISYTYATTVHSGFTHHRPTQVSSSLGYHLTITYQGPLDDIANPGWGAPQQVTLYKTGDPAPLGQLTYEGANVTNLGGRTFNCTGCSNALGSGIEVTGGTLTLHGEGSPALQVSGHSTAPLVASVTRDGVAWTYSYGNPRLYAPSSAWRYDSVTVTGPDGFRQVYTIEGLGQLAAQANVIAASTDSIDRITRYEHDSAFRVKKIVLPERNEIAVDYDTFGNIVRKTTTPKPFSGLSPVVEEAFYPTGSCLPSTVTISCYRPTWSKDGLGRQTDYVWNDKGQLLEQTDPPDQHGIRTKTYIEYDQSGGLSRKKVVRLCGLGQTCGTNQEIRTEYFYSDNTFLPSRERRIDAYHGRTRDTHFTYDPAGRLLSADGPLPGPDDAAYNRYDVHGRLTWEIGPKGADGLRIAKRIDYRVSDDKLWTVWTGTVADPNAATLTAHTRADTRYDDRRNPNREFVSEAVSGATHTVLDRSFDARGRLVCETRRMNKDAFNFLPGDACTPSLAGAQGPDRITRNHYDAAGQLRRVEKGVATSLRQDYAQYEYTDNGKRRAVIDANGNRAEMSFDGFDRQKRWIFPSTGAPGRPPLGQPDPADYEEYSYDLVGNRLTHRKRDNSTLTYAYDNLNRVIRKIVPERAGLTAAQTRDVHYDYNHPLGLQTKARFDGLDGPGVTNYYDAFGQPTTTLLTMDGQYRYVSYYHDDAGNLVRLTHPDGVHFGYAYDATGRTTLIQENRAAPSLDDWIVRYWYNAAGSRHSAVRGAGSGGFYTVYYRDALQRLSILANDLPGTVNDAPIEFGYNPASQIVSRTIHNIAYASPPEVNRSLAYQVNGLNQYIAASNRTYAYDANGNLTSDGTTAYVYDVENRLVAASGATNASLVYDPLGRLVQTSSPGGASTYFYYDGDSIIAEYDGSGTLTKRYVYGPGADEPVAVYEGSAFGLANRRYMLPDERGSIAALVNADGSPSAINRYDSWGIPGAGNQGRFQYTGQAWIPELGMYHYKARIYSPMLGRFLQTDPIGYEDQINLYAYVGNDPINSIDPTGQIQMKNGKFRFSFPSRTSRISSVSPSGRIGDLQKGIMFTDNGETFDAYTNRGDRGFDVNCHGFTFTRGRGDFWIDNSEVDTILRGDNYSRVSTAAVDDVAIYRQDGEVVHSGIVRSVNEQGETMVESEFGATEDRKTLPGAPGPGGTWHEEGKVTTVEYHRQKPPTDEERMRTGTRFRD